MRNALLALIGIVAGSVSLWSGATGAAAVPAGLVSNSNVLRAANDVSRVNHRRYYYAPVYYPGYYYAPRAYGYYLPPPVYYPPPVTYYAPPVPRYYAPPVEYTAPMLLAPIDTSITSIGDCYAVARFSDSRAAQ
jgi:hypothetical protein